MKEMALGFSAKIFLIALILRFIPVIALRSVGIGLDDMFQYDMLARSIASGNGYRWYNQDDIKLLEPYVDFDLDDVVYDPVRGVSTSFRPPLYPTFLAILYLLFGTGAQRFLLARLAQCFLGASLAPLTYAIGMRLLSSSDEGEKKRNQRVAIISAWIVAFYPILLFYPFGLATENLFFPLILLAFLLLMKAGKEEKNKNIIFAGIFLGLASLTRSVILLFALFAIAWFWKSSHSLKKALLLATTVILLVSPWMVRNSLLHGKPSGIEVSMGYSLYVSYHPEGNGSFKYGISLDLIPIMDDAKRDEIGMASTREFIRAYPERVLPLVISRLSYLFGLEKRVLVYFYANNFIGPIPSGFLILFFGVMLLPFVFILLTAPIGLVTLPRDRNRSLLLLLLAGYILPHALIIAEDRFHLVLVPFLIILAVSCWSSGYQPIKSLWHGSLSGKLAIGTGCIIAVFVLFNFGWEIFRDWQTLVKLILPGGNTLYLPY